MVDRLVEITKININMFVSANIAIITKHCSNYFLHYLDDSLKQYVYN